MNQAQITITARPEAGGLLVSLHTDGDFSDEMISRRFYSIAELPPDDLPSAEFWSPILATVAGFLAPEPEEDHDMTNSDVDPEAYPDERDVDDDGDDELYEYDD